MQAYLQFEKEKVIGVIKTEWGTTLKYPEEEIMTTFKTDAGDAAPPYLDFIYRGVATGTLPIDWEARHPDARTLREFQKEAVDLFMGVQNGHTLLVADAGLGKTTMAATAMGVYLNQGGKVLVLAPTSQGINWQKTWLACNPNKPAMQILKTKAMAIKSNVVVASYGVAKEHPELLRTTWDYAIVDESQTIKNENPICVTALTPVLVKTTAIMLLSATPMESRPAELFTQLRVMFPDVFTDRRVFTKRYADAREENGIWMERGSSNLDELAIMMKTCMLRYKKDDVDLGLPDKTRFYRPFNCKKGGAFEAELHATELERKVLADKVKSAVGSAATLIAQNHQNRHVLSSLNKAGMIKTKLCGKWIQEFILAHPDDKIVLFCKNLDVAAALRKLVVELNIEYIYVDGSVSNMEKRFAMLESISKVDGPARVAILTLRTCSTGITLCPGANIVVIVELDFKPSTMSQAEERVHRIGAVKACEYHWLMLRGSADFRVDKTLCNKRTIINTVMDGSKKRTFTYMTQEDEYETAENEATTAEVAAMFPEKKGAKEPKVAKATKASKVAKEPKKTKVKRQKM